MRKSPSYKAHLRCADTVPDNTRYIQVSRNNGRKARRCWLSGVREAEIGPGDLVGVYDAVFGSPRAALAASKAASRSGNLPSDGPEAAAIAGFGIVS